MRGWTRVRRGAIAATAAGGLAVSGVLVWSAVAPEEPAVAAATAPAAATAVGDGPQEPGPGQLLDRLPDALAADLRALHELPPAERLGALEDLRDAALAGEYGEQAQQVAGRLAAALVLLPPELRADLEDVVALEDPAAVRAALEQIGDRAGDGGYGPQVQAGADRLRAAVAAVPDELRADLEDLRELPPAERSGALAGIVRGALEGAYGEQVRAVAERLTALAGRAGD